MNISTKQIADALGVGRKAVLQKAKKEKWRCLMQRGKILWPSELLPEEIKIALSRTGLLTIKKIAAPVVFTEATEAERRTSKLRASIINAYKTSGLGVQEFCEAFNEGFIASVFKTEYGKLLNAKTFYRWLKEFKNAGVAGLTPLYSQSCKKSGAGASLSEDEKECLKKLYLHYNKRSIRQCFLTMKENIVSSVASYATCKRYLQSIGSAADDLYRSGQEVFENKHFPYIKRNRALYKALDQVQGDHHRFDRVVRHNGKIIHPWITSFADVRSGAILGWCVSVNPNSQTILAAYYMMITLFGIPKAVHVDNGKDYKGKTIKGQEQKMKVLDEYGFESEERVIIDGAIVTCGSELIYARPWHGQSKGVQERFYDFLENYYSKNTNNYTGSNTASRVDEQKLYWRALKGKAKREDVTEWPDFVKEVAYWIQWYNTKWKSEADGKKGLTAEQAFLQNLPEQIKRPDPALVQLALTRGEVRTVAENGVRMGGVDYWGEELMGLTGQQVIARVNLVNRNEMLVCDHKGRLLCKAYANVFMESGDMEADNEFVNSVRRGIRQKVREQVGGLSYNAKTMLDIAKEASGIELPSIEQYIPPAIEDAKAAGAENQKTKSKYINYFDADLEVL